MYWFSDLGKRGILGTTKEHFLGKNIEENFVIRYGRIVRNHIILPYPSFDSFETCTYHKYSQVKVKFPIVFMEHLKKANPGRIR
jgi:hypothetical protein